ncbi:hypothetical protein ACJROX_27360 [Pseudalkalibacillus sp. A8]|uniref:hypothetical protein n=1 Tax=Pseudalkalibacillus sp. A8 TaxID=3382641 RepID=UPI0038B52AE8
MPNKGPADADEYGKWICRTNKQIFMGGKRLTEKPGPSCGRASVRFGQMPM